MSTELSGIEAGSPTGPSVHVTPGTVIWWGTDTPLTYGCRVCGQVVYRDVSGRPVYEVYPSPVLCSGECSDQFLAILLPPDHDDANADEDRLERTWGWS